MATRATADDPINEKRLEIARNKQDFCDQLLEAPHAVRCIWSLAVNRIGTAIGIAPFRRHAVKVFDSDEVDGTVDFGHVKAAAKLLRHPAMGYRVKAMRSEKDGAESFRIVYSHDPAV